MSVEIPAIHGDIGEWSFDFVHKSPNSGPKFPTRPVIDEGGKKVAWIRYLSPAASERLDIRPTTDRIGNLLLRTTGTVTTDRLQEAVESGNTQAEAFKALESYGIRIANSSALICEVDSVPSTLLVTEHVEGPRLSDWLRDPEVPASDKKLLSSQLMRKLSAYARDTAILTMRDKHNGSYFQDIASPRQYVVNNGEPVLIDVGPEHLATESHGIVGDGLSLFHHRLVVSDLFDYVNEQTIDEVKNDLYSVREVELETHTYGSSYDALVRWDSPRHIN